MNSNFYWGAATSSHQVEGNSHNDWAEWEKQNAGRLAHDYTKTFWWMPKMADFKQQAENPQNYISGNACDHYHRFREDFDIAKSLGHNAHRFSIEWSRIEPEKGKFDEKEIEHYRQVIQALKERGLEPFVTLYHWTLPIWFRDEGGWLNPRASEYFTRYTEKIASRLGNSVSKSGGVKFWITLNEPNVYTAFGFYKGIWPPNKGGLVNYLRSNRNLIRAHRQTYDTIKKINSESQVGIAQSLTFFEAARGAFVNKLIKFFVEYYGSWYVPDRIRHKQDFVGINYYSHNRIDWGLNKNENTSRSDMGWEIYPEGFYHVIRDAYKRYGKPIYIFENGIADNRDEKRAQFIKDHVLEMNKAKNEGIDIRGYFYWSLLDNFEWDKGFWPRFGLVEIDYKTTERKIRPSALEYKKIIDTGL